MRYSMTSFILKVTLTQMDCKLFKELHQDFSDAPMGKNPPANAGDTGSLPGPGRLHKTRGNWAQAPQLLSPRAARKPSPSRASAWKLEQSLRREARAPQAERSPRGPQLDSPSAATKTLHSQEEIHTEAHARYMLHNESQEDTQRHTYVTCYTTRAKKTHRGTRTLYAIQWENALCVLYRDTEFDVLCRTNNLHNLVVSSFNLLKTGKTTLTSRHKTRLWAGFGP